MEEIALGRLGMTEQELFDISPRSLFNKINGAQHLENQKWERLRVQAYFSLLPHMDKKKPITPQSLMKFPWDKKEKVQDRASIKKRHEAANKIWAMIDAGKNRDVEQ